MIISKLKERAQFLKREIGAVYYAFGHKNVGIVPKILIALAIGYTLSPIDLIPDFIPFFGQLDDLVIVPALIALALKTIPKNVIKECRQKAHDEPIILKKNWIFAIGFICIWIFLLGAFGLSIVRLFGLSI